MKQLLIILILTVIGCSDNYPLDINKFTDNQSILAINGTWKVLSYEDYVTNKVEYRTESNSKGYDTVVTFDNTKTPKEITGTNTTNTILGQFDYSSARELTLQGLSTTYVYQPDWGDRFLKVFTYSKVNFKINESGLRIYYDGQHKSVTFSKQ